MTKKRRPVRTAYAATVTIRVGRKVYTVSPSADSSASTGGDDQAELDRAHTATDTKAAVSDPRRRVGRDDVGAPTTAEMLPMHWD